MRIVVFHDRIFLTLISTLSSLARSHCKESTPQRELCFIAIGRGNMGDRGLLESCVLNLPSTTRFIGTLDAQALFNEVGIDAERTFTYSYLYLFNRWKRIRDLFRLALEISRAKIVYVVGADNLDGAYSNFFSSLHWNVALAAAASKKPSTVLGFSWNESPSKLANKLRIKAQKQGVELMVRDSISFQRLSDSCGRGLRQVADLVFSNRYLSEMSDFYDRERQEPSEPYVIVSGTPFRALRDNKTHTLEDFLPIFKAVGQDYQIHLVPTVCRANQNDLDIYLQIQEKYGDQYEFVIYDRLLSPSEYFKLCRNGKLLITFRMHPAIIAMQAGLPTVMFEYQGKMQGLARDLGVENYVLDFAQTSEVNKVINQALEHNDAIKVEILSSIEGQRKRADLNFLQRESLTRK